MTVSTAKRVVEALRAGRRAGRMFAMRDGSTPYDPKDPYWVFKEAAAFEREFQQKVELPMLAAMAESVDRMWQEAIDRTAGREGN